MHIMGGHDSFAQISQSIGDFNAQINLWKTIINGQKSICNRQLDAKKWLLKVKPQSCQKTVNVAVQLTI